MTIWEHQMAIAEYLKGRKEIPERSVLPKEVRKLKKEVVKKDSVGRPLHLKRSKW
jgi:hypothetical protein